MIRKPKTIHFWRGDLPHWQVEDGHYFVTIHLDGAIPKAGQKRIRAISEQIRREAPDLSHTARLSTRIPNEVDKTLELSRMIFREMEAWLDRASPAIYLQTAHVAEMVMEAVEYRCQEGVWEMFQYTVMPSHLHLFFELAEGLSLKHELEEFKRWTGHRATAICAPLHGNRFWQTEWFDHWSRSAEQDDHIVDYIRRNPVKAGLVNAIEGWPYRG